MKFRVLMLAVILSVASACKDQPNASAPGQTIGNTKDTPVADKPSTSDALPDRENPSANAAASEPISDKLREGTQEQKTLLIQAKTAYLTDDLDTAEGLFRHLANSEPISGPTVTATLALGQIYIGSDRKDQAFELYKLLVADVPHIAEVQLVIARAYASVGEPTAAMRAFEKALELQPDFIFVHTELGNLFLQVGRNDDATAQFLKYEQRIYAMAKALENPKTPDAERLQIIESFGLVADDRATQATVAALTDPHPQIRLTAAATLGDLNVSAALDILQKMAIEDPDMQVRMTARSSVNALKNAPHDDSATLAPQRVESADDLPK